MTKPEGSLIWEVIERAFVMIENQGKISPKKIALYIVTGQFSAAISSGVLAVGYPDGRRPFIRVTPNGEENQVEVADYLTRGLIEEVLEEFRKAMILEDLASA